MQESGELVCEDEKPSLGPHISLRVSGNRVAGLEGGFFFGVHGPFRVLKHNNRSVAIFGLTRLSDSGSLFLHSQYWDDGPGAEQRRPAFDSQSGWRS